MADPAEELAEYVQGVLSDAVHRRDGSVLTKYVACVEVLSADGERALWCLSSADLKAWETIGMLEFARDLDRGVE